MAEPTTRPFGKYDIIEEIGKGSMGTVYLGCDRFADKLVAIKVAHGEALSDERSGNRYRKLFFNEAKTAGMLRHPNIVAVHDAGFEEDAWYIAMEYVSGGKTLYAHTRPDTLLPFGHFLHAAFKCAKALDYAHRKGVIHRDIKPKNVLLTDAGDVKLSDFSVALRTGKDVAETQVEGYLGSPLYMSPEQVRGDPLTHRTDLFSFGVMMYELLTGKMPFLAPSITAIIYQITTKTHPPIREIRADVPPALAAIVDRCLAKEPGERYASALELAAELSRLLDELGASQEELPRSEKFKLLERLSFFDEFSEPEIWELLNAAVWEDYEAGEDIIHEGEADNSFYVIVRGDVSVLKGETEVDSLREGDCFGETGFIPGQVRTTGIVAKRSVSTIKVRSVLIERTSKDTQLKFHRIFLNKIIQRLSRSEERASRSRVHGAAVAASPGR